MLCFVSCAEFLKGVYNFSSGTTEAQWSPYVGFGLVLIQEMDNDIESTTFSERS